MPRRPVPQELKKKRGTARKDRAPENPVKVTKAAPKKTTPSFLKAKGKMMTLTLNQSDLLRLDQSYLFILQIILQLTQYMPLSFLISTHNFEHIFALIPQN